MERKKNKQPKLHVKTGDLVVVIAGDEKGNSGTIVAVDMEKRRAIIGGLNMVKRHVKPSAQNPEGGIIEKEATIHISNLMVVDPTTGVPARSGRKLNAKGKLERFFKKSKREKVS
jgi:large subunit ribosomal protein L24